MPHYSGALFSKGVILSMGSPFLADAEFSSILSISPQWLTDRGVRLLLLDFDNTVIPYTETEPSREFLQWRAQLEGAGIRLMIVSNSRKSRRVPDFCERWNMEYIRHAGKPRPGGILRAVRQQGADISETALAGDQTYTDVLGANLAGVLSILVHPLHFSNPFQAVRYGLELPFILAGRKKRGIESD